MKSLLPNFKRPPVTETVLGLEFTPIEEWSIADFGLFLAKHRDEFARFESKAELTPSIESFTEQILKTEPRLELIDAPEIRGWYFSNDDKEVVQIQKDRFIFNWRKAGTDDPYPRYEQRLRPRFEHLFDLFIGFLYERKLAVPNVQQCEVSYVNHIPRGASWQTPEDWRRVFTVFGTTSDRKFLPKAEGGTFGLSYLMPDNRGRLRVSVSPAVKRGDSALVLQFNLTARIKPTGQSRDALLEALDLGREWVVRGFKDLTTFQMHQEWGLET